MIQHVVTILVTTIVISAGKIVWDGATTWKEEVLNTKANLQVLIDNLSEKLVSYEGRMDSFSNQVAQLQATLETSATSSPLASILAPAVPWAPTEEDTEPLLPVVEKPKDTWDSILQMQQQAQQEMIKGDLQKSFKK